MNESTHQGSVSDIDLLEQVRLYYHGLYSSMINGEISFADAVGRIPLPLFYFFAGSPGRTGFALEEHAQLALSTRGTPEKVVLSMAHAVMALVAQNEDEASKETRDAIEYHWSTLRGYVFNAVAPGRSQHWLVSFVRIEDAEDLVVRALNHGATVYNQGRNESVWRHDHWESAVTTVEIVRWFREACETARQDNEAQANMIKR